MTINKILDEFRQTSSSPRELGDKFERLMLTYLKTENFYKDHFSQVWLWMDFPKRGNMPDTGIDLVAVERYTGDYWAIQCKCYSPDQTVEKSDIDSFFTASGTNLFKQRMIISTTAKWSKHALAALKDQQIPVILATIHDLENSSIDWDKFSLKNPDHLELKPKKQIRPHQQTALEKVLTGFKNADRGKLIMACGTGKTFTALKIAENFPRDNNLILFLVPSISLLSQTLREWTAESDINFHSIAVCSDVNVGKNNKKSKNDDVADITVNDLAFPPTTNAQDIIKSYHSIQSKNQSELTVIFSTYQSIQAISDAQKKGLPEFDLIICDEAHRTTGVTISGEDESYFVKVHNQDFIQAKKRLYMTATPKIYHHEAKNQAQENDVLLCSMDDVDLYGKEFHRLGFGEAVSADLLSDYKVMVLAVDKNFVNATFQQQISDGKYVLNLDDKAKIIGCWNGLAKRILNDEEGDDTEDKTPMKRAVAFCRTIEDSEKIVKLFAKNINDYQKLNPEDETILQCELQHVDGKQNALQRNEKLEWLKAEPPLTPPARGGNSGNICRILSNARCLSEGVDVPALDAVIFFTPRNSVVDVVQSVGRVMRKAEGKKYGYIILPVSIAADIPPEIALKDNEYQVIWRVLQALRSHDERFNDTINKIELNKRRPDKINIIGIGGKEKSDSSQSLKIETTYKQLELNFPIEEWRDAIYAKIVTKCGNRRYWEDWAKDVAKIAESNTSRIKALLENSESEAKKVFDEFITGLHQNINPNVTEDEAIEMLSQHLITKPVFDALFEGYEFTKYNPVSQTMQRMLDVLEGQSLQKEVKTLDKFYQSVRERASGIDNAEGKQRIIIELYDKFFRAAFPRLVERLGIVYTPVEVVDFIIKSADFALKQEFGVGLTDEGVHILDPFTGTGTFMVRLLQSGLIKPEDLQRKFTSELHANEIVLLAYYIAAINIEESYHYLSGNVYQPFNGIVLTDTFQMFENAGYLLESIFPENNQRVINQKQRDITVIIGNPPYSAGQTSENDGNKNLKYENLDQKIANSYAKYSSATNKNSLYDSYIRGFRWASDRIKDQGIVCFVSNGSFIDNNAMDGFRKCLVDEFTSIYCFNLRGNQRTSGEQSRKEGGKIFGSGSRATIAIIFLIKNSSKKSENKVFYHDIGDYLSQKEKLDIIKDFGDISTMKWQEITPNENHDWINQRNDDFESFISLGDKKDATSKTIFDVYSRGLETTRDIWVYNFSYQSVIDNITRMIDFYNQQVEEFKEYLKDKRFVNTKDKEKLVESFVDTDTKKISWSSSLKQQLQRIKIIEYQEKSIVKGIYRPFCKQWIYFDNYLNHRVGQMPKIFPNQNLENLVICVTGIGVTKDFNALIVNTLSDIQLQANGQCFPLYTYEKQSELGELFATATTEQYTKKENIPDSIFKEYQQKYEDTTITKSDIFYYIYGVLHSPEYKQRFASDLKKMLPRIPFTADFWTFSKAGRELAYWHINYETIEPYELEEFKKELYLDEEDYRVEKMVFGKNKNGLDKTIIIYNSKLTLSQIPLEAYEYIVNGKSALEWIMERYKVTKDKDSGIINDPNHWSENPRYIVDLVKRIVRVSLETVRIVKSLPPLNEW
ncbi:DEAD/DEAH box helicase [Dolichospermum circinale]|uniref:DEAD/DEAH box helicase n=1 Tax=Dolichospermum circinale TaxID=109265 RepID=UPI00232AA43C|nr:type ISP restriction/modification enzyme [Dolichospermum circinale]MDB9454939.1 DEAD/DEAH box helicase family protein [Dolichospermum circinale CS-541/06]MDB9463450.1 DEAD/DEAH box helicase family protein [Dolichospermum circinale CS-541/04]MDB9548789.1 DEAD/DEAH box helicase family protein [Dolichospermum circinale CS-1031]